MALLIASNAETGIYSAEGWTRLGAGLEVVRDNVVAHGGSWSWLVAGDGVAKNSSLVFTTQTLGNWLIQRYWVRLNNLPTVIEDLQCLPYCGSNPTAFLSVQPDGRLAFNAGTLANNLPVAFSPALGVGVWNKVEWALVQPSANTMFSIARLNDVEFARQMGRLATTPGALTRWFANVASGVVCRQNIDDIVINNDLGSGNCYWNDADKPRTRGKTAPSVRSVATPIIAPSGPASVVVNAPPTIVTGDLLVGVIYCAANRDPPGVPSGWTVIRSSGSSAGTVMVVRKRATGSEPSSYTFTLNAGAVATVSTCYALRNVDVTSPVIDALSVSGGLGGNGTQLIFPGLDLSEGDTLILQAAGLNTAPNINVPGSWGSVSGGKDGTTFQELRTGVISSADGGLRSGGGTTTTANMTNYASATVAFRASPVPAARKFMALA